MRIIIVPIIILILTMIRPPPSVREHSPSVIIPISHNIPFADFQILSEDGNTICLDASNENHCNWMSLVQVAKTAEEQNCMAYQLGINIYFNTTQDIASGTPLKVWYATKYAQKLGKPTAPDGKTRCEFCVVCPTVRDGSLCLACLCLA